MEPSDPLDVGNPDLKRRRTDSGYGGLSQSSRATSPGIKRQDTLSTQYSSGKRACSPILLSDDLDLEITILEESKVNPSEPTVTIHLGTQRQEIPQSKLLSHIWRYGLDSPCMVCGLEFTLDGADPPIRTYTFETSDDLCDDSEDITQIPVAPHALRVINRHMGCIKAKRISYIAISHVWHEAVSAAQISQTPDMAAARLAYQVPVRTLLALTKSFGATEVWHDYISVPQWHREVQQQLVLQIPVIFAYPSRMVMHLDDVGSAFLDAVEDSTDYSTFIEAISRLTGSRWFDRMWVALEYIQSKEVSVLTQYYDIFDTSASELSEIVEINIGKYVKRLGQDRFHQLARSKGFDWQKRASWDDMETWKKLDPKYRTLGGAIFILGQKKCRDHHDYFFALRGLLDLGQDHSEVKTILANDTFESYLDLAWSAFKKGDYSPLLFIPQNSEPTDPRAPWLRGHSKLTQTLWDYGTCRRLPKHCTIIRDRSLKPNLESVGVVESFESFDFVGSPEAVLQRFCLKHIATSGVSAQNFCNAVDRVFPSIKHKGVFWAALQDSEDKGGDVTVYELERIASVLDRFSFFAFKGENPEELLQLSKKLVSLLGLSLPEKQSHISRIKSAMNEADFYGRKRDGLASVRCKGCSEIFLFRITAWETLPPVDATGIELYRIPGLLYDDTVPDGVGIVTSGGKIVGKTASATPACECRISELVELGLR